MTQGAQGCLGGRVNPSHFHSWGANSTGLRLTGLVSGPTTVVSDFTRKGVVVYLQEVVLRSLSLMRVAQSYIS